MLSNYNFTWGEQPECDEKYASNYPLPDSWIHHESKQIHVTEYNPIYTVLNNILCRKACSQWIAAVEKIGFQDSQDVTDVGKMVLEDSKKTGIPVIWMNSDKIRTNNRCIWQVPKQITDNLFQKLKPHLPQTVVVDGRIWEIRAINRRFRFFKTSKDQEFYSHIDASSARMNEDKRYERSFFTLVVWLNSSYSGGELEFMDGDSILGVKGRRGCCIYFPQDGHPNPAKHRGMPVKKGIKYILRTDVFYGCSLSTV
jgi:hypothetical protein